MQGMGWGWGEDGVQEGGDLRLTYHPLVKVAW